MAFSKSLAPYALLPASFSFWAYSLRSACESCSTVVSSISGRSSVVSTLAALEAATDGSACVAGAEVDAAAFSASASLSACFRFRLSFLLSLGVVSLGSCGKHARASVLERPWQAIAAQGLSRRQNSHSGCCERSKRHPQLSQQPPRQQLYTQQPCARRPKLRCDPTMTNRQVMAMRASLRDRQEMQEP